MAEYIVLFAFISLVFIIQLIATCVKNSSLENIILIIITAVTITMTIVFIIMYKQLPHHGNKPTISDVPENAHVQEHKYITNNDTTITYTIEWNDWNGKIILE